MSRCGIVVDVFASGVLAPGGPGSNLAGPVIRPVNREDSPNRTHVTLAVAVCRMG